MKKIILLLILMSNFAFAQKINNNLKGFYKAKSDTLLYNYFSFDGAGKVDISGYGKGDYFQKGDSLIIFPDKDIFKFKIERNTLKGVSTWVEKGIWAKQDTLMTYNEIDGKTAMNRANLLHEYYEKTNQGKSNFEILFDEQKMKEHTDWITSLCDRGLPKACMELLGLKIMNDMGGAESLLSNKVNKNVKENPEIIALGEKISNMGEPNVHAVMGSYYYSLGLKEKANKEWDNGTEKGCMKCEMTKFSTEMEAELQKTQKKPASTNKRKAPVKKKK